MGLKTKRFAAITAVVTGFALLAGCETPQPGTAATGQPAAAPEAAETTAIPVAAKSAAPGALSTGIPAGKARVVVFRGSSWGLVPNLMKPVVKLDGAETAQCDLGHVIVRDVTPGAHEVSMQTDIVSKAAVTLQEGQTAYFKCLVLPFGLVVNAPKVELVPAGKVPAEVTSLPRR